MNQDFRCPYCARNSYAKGSKKQGIFTSWYQVRQHLSSCTKNNKTFLVDNLYGPIKVEELSKLSVLEIKVKYPKLKLRDRTTLKNEKNYIATWTKELIISSIKSFYDEHNKIPISRDFEGTSYKYPTVRTVRKYFGTWNAAIEAAGYIPNIQNGYGTDTRGLDGHMYRSASEAYFADTYLHNKYEYLIEPKYPDPYNKYYDWYIPSLNLYIELDGGIRPLVTDEKKSINKLLHRNCIFIHTSSIYKTELILSVLK